MASIETKAIKLRPFDFDDYKAQYLQSGHPLNPIAKTDGLVFMITPTISEQTQVNYMSTSMVHTNEDFLTYQNTGTRVITLGDIKFPCDTYDNTRYAMAALHFFRTYSYMDYGQKNGIRATGRPPSPMWFSGLGDYMYKKVPVLYGGYEFSINNAEHDLVGISNPEQFASFVSNGTITPTNNLNDDITTFRNKTKGEVNWLPTVFTFGSITLKVQHSPNYWKNTFSLEDFRAGKLLTKGGGW